MNIVAASIPAHIEIAPQCLAEMMTFLESWSVAPFAAVSLDLKYVQNNRSRSEQESAAGSIAGSKSAK